MRLGGKRCYNVWTPKPKQREGKGGTKFESVPMRLDGPPGPRPCPATASTPLTPSRRCQSRGPHKPLAALNPNLAYCAPCARTLVQHEAAQARAHASLERGRPVRLAAPASAAATRRLARLAASLQARALRTAPAHPSDGHAAPPPTEPARSPQRIPKVCVSAPAPYFPALLRHHLLSLAPRIPPARACAELARSKGRQHCRAAHG